MKTINKISAVALFCFIILICLSQSRFDIAVSLSVGALIYLLLQGS